MRGDGDMDTASLDRVKLKNGKSKISQRPENVIQLKKMCRTRDFFGFSANCIPKIEEVS